ncbi:MAG: hypothetical protein RLY89_1467 [Bacteroidota bacterium]|jgi:uncharacterized membrane protein
MKNNQWLNTIVILAALGMPLLYLASVYSFLPETVPTHFNLEGKADGFGKKSTLIFKTILLDVVGLSSYFLMKYLPQIDPKKSAGQSPVFLNKIGLVLVVFMGILNKIIIQSSVNSSFNGTKYILPLLSLLFVFMGNYMHTIKPNYFAGFRTPWALEDPDNWRATHLLAGKIWVIGGLVAAILSLVLPSVAGWIVFTAITVIISIVPFIFSFRYYKKHQS